MSKTASKPKSRAVEVALAHIEAWNNRDYESARSGLSDDVHVTVTTTQPTMPPTDTVGAEEYMRGLVKFGEVVVPGSAQINGSAGDDRNALVMVTVKAVFGPGGPEVPLVGARLYMLNDNAKIQSEQVVFCVLGQ
ncbi:MAG TPA: nuclear transport factor 2 family protein [Nitrososphaerales archaeon]|nr:nuclear transport factor 2 family protein [Nitrososphaerales archaeon]